MPLASLSSAQLEPELATAASPASEVSVSYDPSDRRGCVRCTHPATDHRPGREMWVECLRNQCHCRMAYDPDGLPLWFKTPDWLTGKARRVIRARTAERHQKRALRRASGPLNL